VNKKSPLDSTKIQWADDDWIFTLQIRAGHKPDLSLYRRRFGLSTAIQCWHENPSGPPDPLACRQSDAKGSSLRALAVPDLALSLRPYDFGAPQAEFLDVAQKGTYFKL
jgi:hypothetical protein